jgi:hypothetical protein
MLGSAAPAHAAGLTITPTFTSNFASLMGAAGETAWENAAAVYTSTFSGPVLNPLGQNLNITVDAVAGTNVFGESSFFLTPISYSALQSVMSANAALTGNPDQLASVAAGGSLSTANPDPAATYWLNTAQAKGLNVTSYTGTDGTTTFGAGNPWFFGTNGTPANQYYFEGVALHEISEVMGRQGLKSGTIGGSPDSHSLLDLFAYTGAGARSLTNGDNAFFSIDNGTTLLKEYNNNTVNGLDSRDWFSPTGLPADAYNQFSNSGVDNLFTAVDQRVMNVIGYNLPHQAPVPEPSTFWMAILGGALSVGYGWRRRRAAA